MVEPTNPVTSVPAPHSKGSCLEGVFTAPKVAQVDDEVMARQDGPQEPKPELCLALKARQLDEAVLGEFHPGPQALACNQGRM